MMDQETAQLIADLRARVAGLESTEYSHYKGAQAGDFTTTTLPHHGDYGYQTTDNEVQMNCNGTVRAISTAAL